MDTIKDIRHNTPPMTQRLTIKTLARGVNSMHCSMGVTRSFIKKKRQNPKQKNAILQDISILRYHQCAFAPCLFPADAAYSVANKNS